MNASRNGSYNDSESLSSPAHLSPIYFEDGERTSRSQSLRIAVAIVLLLSIVLVVIDSFTSKRIETTALAFFDWVEVNPFRGVLSVILLYIFATSTYWLCHHRTLPVLFSPDTLSRHQSCLYQAQY